MMGNKVLHDFFPGLSESLLARIGCTEFDLMYNNTHARNTFSIVIWKKILKTMRFFPSAWSVTQIFRVIDTCSCNVTNIKG